MNDTELQPTKCVSAEETRQVYLALAASKKCGGKRGPCMKDECAHCGPLNALIDERGDECLARGCRLSRCVYDD